MSEAFIGEGACGAFPYESGHAAALGAADWLGLAAAPTFACMALLTAVLWRRAGHALLGRASVAARAEWRRCTC